MCGNLSLIRLGAWRRERGRHWFRNSKIVNYRLYCLAHFSHNWDFWQLESKFSADFYKPYLILFNSCSRSRTWTKAIENMKGNKLSPVETINNAVSFLLRAILFFLALFCRLIIFKFFLYILCNYKYLL